jgi:hypothetical protein
VKLGLSKIKRLRNLEVVTTPGEHGMLPWLQQELAERTGPSFIETIAVKLSRGDPEEVKDMPWEAWGDSLSDEALFPKLKNVVVKFAQNSWPDAERQDATDSVWTRLLSLRIRGVFRLEECGGNHTGRLPI